MDNALPPLPHCSHCGAVLCLPPTCCVAAAEEFALETQRLLDGKARDKAEDDWWLDLGGEG